MNGLLNFSLESISNLLSFTSTYGVLLLFTGLIVLGIKFYNSLKFEFLFLALVCFVELFINFLLDPENVHTSYFLLYAKIIAIIIFSSRLIYLEKSHFNKIVGNIIITISSIFICVISLNSIMNKSLGKLSSENYENQYVLMKDERLIGSKIFQKVRLEIYNKKDDLQVKVMHNSEKESLISIINKIENLGSHFWEIENKFITIKDLK